MQDGVKVLGDYPALHWPGGGWWLTVFSAIAAAFAIVLPITTDLPLALRIVLCAVLVGCPGLVFVICHFAKVGRLFCARASQYGKLSMALSVATSERDRAYDTVSALVNQWAESHAFRIVFCFSYQSTIVIALQKKRGRRAAIGDCFRVIDRETGQVFGSFHVYDIGGVQYLAKGGDDIDPLWHGYVVQLGSVHSAPPPDALAIPVTQTGDE